MATVGKVSFFVEYLVAETLFFVCISYKYLRKKRNRF